MTARNPNKSEQADISELVAASRTDAAAAQQTAQAHEIAATQAQASAAAADAFAAQLRADCGIPAGTALNEQWQWCDREGRRLVADIARTAGDTPVPLAADG